MQIGEKIKNYRKTAGLTQEQVADYLDVSTPAVNKWEKGNTYPDISLLPAIARLLKIDMNELFSFREELTEKEIGQFVNELSEVSLASFIKAFEMGKNKIKEYRKMRKLTQDDLAKEVDVTRQTIISLENGKYVASLQLALKMAKFFNVSVEDLFSLEEE